MTALAYDIDLLGGLGAAVALFLVTERSSSMRAKVASADKRGVRHRSQREGGG